MTATEGRLSPRETTHSPGERPSRVELDDLHVRTLGECRVPSPFSVLLTDKHTSPHFVHEDDRVCSTTRCP